MKHQFEDIFAHMIGLIMKGCQLWTGICIFLVGHSASKMSWADTVHFHTYIAFMLYFPFVISFVADELDEVSSRFLYDTYSSDWITTGLGTRRKLMIFRQNLEHSVVISVTGQKEVNLRTFYVVSLAFFLLNFLYLFS